MTAEQFSLIEKYMISCMSDSAHDKEHIYRVLYNALNIAETENNVDCDVLIAACLLHDIARKEQFENPHICHAMYGGEKACSFLISNGFDAKFADKVKHCIQTHRFRKSNQPQTVEAKILFDADKLDVCGAVGIARTLVYKGAVSDPLYNLSDDGTVSDGSGDISPSFFQEYKFKLENMYSRFYTAKGAELAKTRQQAAVDFYNNLYKEINDTYKNGTDILKDIIE